MLIMTKITPLLFVSITVLCEHVLSTQSHSMQSISSSIIQNSMRMQKEDPKEPYFTKTFTLKTEGSQQKCASGNYDASSFQSSQNFHQKWCSVFKLNGGGKAKTDVLERTLATVAMFGFLSILIRKFGENGIIGLILVAQFAMYKEITSLFRSYHAQVSSYSLKNSHQWQKWLWFLNVQMATSFSVLVTRGVFSQSLISLSKPFLDLISFSLGAISLVSVVVGMSIHSPTGPDAFRAYLGEVVASSFALLFVVGLSSFMILTLKDFGMEWVVFSLLLVVTNDIMAYVFGRLTGKTKILPKLSPKKTVEGFIGAGISTMLISIPLLTYILNSGTKYVIDEGVSKSMSKHAIVLAIYASIVAPFGGFLASAVKRAHFAKDFGSLIPGHGGVVDRVDCQLIMAPFVFLYLRNYLL